MDSARSSSDMSFAVVQLDGAPDEKKMVYAPQKQETWASKLDIDADAATSDRTWAQSFCSPDFAQCCEAYWCPCITYGRNKYLMQHPEDKNLEGFDSLMNGNCWVMFGTGCIFPGAQYIWPLINRIHLREDLKLKGGFAMDCLPLCFGCHACSLAQVETQLRADRKQLVEKNSAMRWYNEQSQPGPRGNATMEYTTPDTKPKKPDSVYSARPASAVKTEGKSEVKKQTTEPPFPNQPIPAPYKAAVAVVDDGASKKKSLAEQNAQELAAALRVVKKAATKGMPQQDTVTITVNDMTDAGSMRTGRTMRRGSSKTRATSKPSLMNKGATTEEVVEVVEG